MSIESVTSIIEEEEIEFVRFEFSDFYGISRCKIIPARHFIDKASNGILIPFCHLSSSIDGAELHLDTPYGNGDVGIGDGVWFPEFNTFRILPWYRKTASILLEPKYYKGEPVSCYPRYIARQQLERLDKMGIALLAAHEHEFHVVDRKTQKPLTSDTLLRSTVGTYTDPNLLNQLMTNLYKVGIDVENCETESGHGQLEIAYKPVFGIQAADNAHVFKTSVKEIAQQNGYIASFMSKPSADHIGCSAHINHSLWDKDGKTNLLYDVNALTSFPKYNRCCMLRLKINGTKGTYIENRSSGGGSNPYLTLAAVVAAGIDGIEKKLPLPEEEIADSFVRMSNNNDLAQNGLPCTLPEAIEAFKADDVIMEAFVLEVNFINLMIYT
ncbi:lengsin-like [Amphiura filiformis]|uniref:lengsin-like n=1 Tax=Amphiura filiformis TaxID=82378 RepID=UPI003B22810D